MNCHWLSYFLVQRGPENYHFFCAFLTAIIFVWINKHSTKNHCRFINGSYIVNTCISSLGQLIKFLPLADWPTLIDHICRCTVHESVSLKRSFRISNLLSFCGLLSSMQEHLTCKQIKCNSCCYVVNNVSMMSEWSLLSTIQTCKNVSKRSHRSPIVMKTDLLIECRSTFYFLSYSDLSSNN